jgi:hypothetical protein
MALGAVTALIVCLLAALPAQPSQPSTEAHARPDKSLLTFLADEHVTRSEVTARLGQPHATFENGLVIAYRLCHDSEGYYVAPEPRKTTELEWQGIAYDLMLRFDDQGNLREHSLIGIRSVLQER